ncbi:MAG TPA: ABC transporter substrate-binding protein [Xanthobacteraceae bacterium]
MRLAVVAATLGNMRRQYPLQAGRKKAKLNAQFNAAIFAVAMRAGASKLKGAVVRAQRKFVQIFTQLVSGNRLLGVMLITMISGVEPSVPASAEDQVTLRLDWTIEGQHLPFVWALDQGYFAAAGIDVKILEGRGSGNTAQLIGAKTDTFGEADASRAALARAQGAPIKVIATFIQRSEGTVVSFPASGINKPADLVGKKVATSEGSSSAVLFQAMLKASGIPQSKIDLVSLDSTAKVASLLQHRVDAITGLMSSECVLVTQKSPRQKVSCMPMADFGVKALGTALIVNDETLKQNPELVQRFVLATLRGWTEAVKNPAKAAAIGKRDFPLADPTILQAQLESVIASMHSQTSMGHPIGWMADADWSDTIATLRSYMGLTSTAPASDYYTNEFIPAEKQK